MNETASQLAIDPASLDRLHDLIAAPPVSWWPIAPGWWFLLGLSTLVFLWFSVRSLLAWRANRYRREALRMLRALPRCAESVVELDTLLKRTALTAYPRQVVASLSGHAWLRFLDETSHGKGFAQSAGSLLVEAAFARPAKNGHADNAAIRQVFTAAEHWIRHHDRQVIPSC